MTLTPRDTPRRLIHANHWIEGNREEEGDTEKYDLRPEPQHRPDEKGRDEDLENGPGRQVQIDPLWGL